MLTINTVLESFGVNVKTLKEGSQLIKIGNTTFTYFYSYDPADCEDFHRLTLNGKDVFFADKSCRHSLRMHEDALRLNKFLLQYGTSATPVVNLVLEEILEGFAFKGHKRIFLGESLEYRKSTSEHSLIYQDKTLWSSSVITQESLEELEKTLKDLFHFIQPKQEKPQMKAATPNFFSTTNVSNNKVKDFLHALHIDPETVDLSKLKAMNSHCNATTIILSSISSAINSDAIIDLSGVIELLVSRVKSYGLGYSKESFIVVLRGIWSDIAKDLHSTPEMHKIIKEFIVLAHKYLNTQEYHKIKDTKSELNVIAIKLLAPQLV